MQHVHGWLFQDTDLLLNDGFKCLIIHKPWQLSPPVLIFEELDLFTYGVITYRREA